MILIHSSLLDSAGAAASVYHARKKSKGVSTAIIALASSSKDVGVEKAFDAGCDDFIARPFHQSELLASIVHAHKSRAARVKSKSTKKAASAGELKFDFDSDRHTANVGGIELHLTFSEFQILNALVEAKGSMVLKAMMNENFLRSASNSRAVDVHICNLRNKLGRVGVAIVTLPRLGYRLDLSKIETLG